MVRWCGDFYKGILMVCEMLQHWGSNVMKSKVERLLDSGAQFEWERVCICK